MQAGQKDPSFARPFWFIAQCMQLDGANGCVAVEEFERRGGPPAQAKVLRRMSCKP